MLFTDLGPRCRPSGHLVPDLSETSRPGARLPAAAAAELRAGANRAARLGGRRAG